SRETATTAAPARDGGTSALSSGATAGAGPGQRRAPSSAPLGLRGWLRWGWRQLTSMRVALLLLLLLTVVAMPGAFFPQRRVDPHLVTQYYEDNPTLAP